MKKMSFIACLMLFAMFEAFSTVVFPDTQLNVSVLSIMPSALEELKGMNVTVLFDEKGRPVGFFRNGSVVPDVRYGNLTLLPYENGSSTIVGSFRLLEATRQVSRLRMEEGEKVDEEILREMDYLKYVYYSERYGSLENYFREMGIDSPGEAVNFLNSLQMSEAADLQSIYQSLENGEVGYTQYLEALKALEKLTGSDLMSSLDEETREMLQNYLKNIQKDVARKALEEVLKNIDRSELDLLSEVLKHIDYSVLYRIARDYVRDAARSGELDRMLDALKESDVSSGVRSAAQEGIKELAKVRFMDYLPRRSAYYLLALASLTLLFALRGVGL